MWYGLLSMVPTSLFGYNRINRAKNSLEKGSRVVSALRMGGGRAFLCVY